MALYLLHIGYSKTGTTAIQRFLAHNRAELPKQGVVYPDVHIRGARLRAPDHNMVGRAAAGRRGWFGLSLQDYIRQFEDARCRQGAERVILSGETFLGAVQPWDYETEADYRKAAAELVQRLAEALSPHDVRVIVYLRRQDHWLESAINQAIKFGGLMPRRVAEADVDTLIDIYRPRLDYAACLSPWVEAFGAENLSVGVYEEFTGDGLLTDFCARTGLERAALETPNWDAATRNTGLNRDVLDVKRVLNRIPRPRYEERVVAEIMRRISAELDAEGGGFSYPMIDAERRIKILQDVEATNRDVAQRFLGRSEQPLFAEAWPDPASTADTYPGLASDKALEIVLRYERERYSFAGRSRVLRHRLAETLRKRMPWLHSVARSGRAAARFLGGGA